MSSIRQLVLLFDGAEEEVPSNLKLALVIEVEDNFWDEGQESRPSLIFKTFSRRQDLDINGKKNLLFWDKLRSKASFINVFFIMFSAA
jgi:hypothetical protein